MMFHRLVCLPALAVCSLCTLLAAPGAALLAQQQESGQQQKQQQPPPQKQPPDQKKQGNPFEKVPEAKEEPKPAEVKPQTGQRPQLETPKPAVEQGPPPSDTIEDIEFRGQRRVPQDTLRALIFSRKGDKYDEDALHRDFMALWNSGRFDDIRLEREPGKAGWIIRFVVTERRRISSIKYEGMKSITLSEVLDRFKERKVGLVTESTYDPNKIQRARNVLQEYEAERGRQFATVVPELHQVPPSSLEVVFRVDEGPKVKVGKINIDGNTAFSKRAVIRAMRDLRPIGVPRSVLFENLFAKTYDSTKLEQDQDMIRVFYQERGYFTAHTTDREVKIVDVGGGKFRIPLFYMNRPGKRANIDLTIEEGRLYHLRNVNFVGVKLFRAPEVLTRAFQMQKGDVFSTAKLRKGIEELRKLYGGFGYIDFVPEPVPEPVPGTDQIDMTVSVDEGKQFFVRRIDFAGNTTTRDKVIRRELLVDEGDVFNQRLWELSILRLNQLGYFEVLKEGEAADIKRDNKTDTVDITLKVKERGKNSIQLNGGVSGIAGSFVGFSYSTNNFLGLGETLSLSSQLGTRVRDVTFGFTEPYFLDRPVQVGFTVFMQRFNYDQGREASVLTGQNLIPLFNSLGQQNLLNYVSNSHGFTVFSNYHLKRSFAQVGLSYGYSVQSIKTLTTAADQYFQYIDFQGVGGPNQLSGIKSSTIIPSYSYNTVNHPITPTAGKSLYIATQFSGSILGGNVNSVQPTIDAKYFRKGFKQGHVIGLHMTGRFLAGFGGKVAPPFSRFYMGGENDIRGFDIWGIGPFAYIPSTANVNIYNNDGSIRQQKILTGSGAQFVNVTQTIPVYQLIFPGGDTQVITNAEYRIPIFGPVVLAAFFDAGIDKLALSSQLALNPGRIDQLNGQFPSAGFTGRAVIAPGTQALRSSTGLELQVLMPVVNAPFRLYWAYNPNRVNTFLQPPIVVDRSYFPNQLSFFNSIAQFGQATPFQERRSTFRFSVGRTF